MKTLHSFVKVPRFNAEQLTEAEDLDEVESVEFQWQEKRFKRDEIERYRENENCKTDAEKRYHLEIVKGFPEGTPVGSIFSYVANDEFRLEEEEVTDTEHIQNVERFGSWEGGFVAGE